MDEALVGIVDMGEQQVTSQESSEKKYRPNILFVDDEKSILDAMRRVFRTVECRVFVADSGRKGLDVMAENVIDLVISDMRMPEMTGAEFLEQVAELYPATVRILLTGYSDIESTVAAINQGKIFSYLSKPWDNDHLKRVVDQALYTKRLEDERGQLVALTREQNEQLQTLNESLEEQVAIRTKALRQTVSRLDKAHDDLKNSYASFVQVFSRLIELREEKPSDCYSQVAEHVRLISGKLELDQETTDQLYYAALLRNIGKMSLSDAGIKEPFERLGVKDKAAYKKHPATGEALLMSVEALQQAASFIRSHRERLDGKGFPDNLIGDAIPFESRILGIASDYDDLVHGMFAEAKITPDAAKAYIESQIDKRYDAAVATAYLQILEEQEHVASKQPETLVSVMTLEEGMVLARDLVTAEGLLLLSKNMALNDRIIDRILQFEKDADGSFSIYVYENREHG